MWTESLILLVVVFLSACSNAKPKSVTIWMIVDGFRADYWDNYDIPHLRILATEGVRVADVTPVFPSSWIPNVASMISGVYTNKHNIVDEVMFDKETKSQFDKTDPRFWEDVVKIGSIWVIRIE